VISRSLALALSLTIGVAVVAGIAAVLLRGNSQPPRAPGAITVISERADWSFVIPAGTGVKLDGGDPVEIVPARIAARVGETIRIENHDDRAYLLGPFFVGAGETLTQQFVTPGRFEGTCAVHPSGQLVLDVSD
jgi:plastocyanin